MAQEIKSVDVPVQIKVITIDKKKMSMSFVRQIGFREIIDYDSLALKGEILGYINYYWSDNSNRQGNSWHLIWHDGDLLHRSLVPVLPSKGKTREELEEYLERRTIGFSYGYHRYIRKILDEQNIDRLDILREYLRKVISETTQIFITA